MSFSIQTNVNSLQAQENLRVNSNFQSQTIQRLTSGYRINSSGDDAAGLAVANKFRTDTAELTQGVRNANDGLSQLQIMDGGLNNVSKILDRMKTLATQAASATFTGSRTTLNNEFSTLKAEIDRQATNIGLVSGGSYNTTIGVYIGGGVGQSNASVNIDLNGTSNRVDSTSLGISASNTIEAGYVGTSTANDAVDLSSGTFLSSSATGKQTFEVTVGGKTIANVDVLGSVAGITGQQAVDQLNTALAQYGVVASIDSTSGYLQFNSNTAFVIRASAALSGGAASAIATVGAGNYATNKAAYNFTKAFTQVAADVQDLTFTVGGQANAVQLAVGDTVDTAAQKINAALNSKGIYAIATGNGDLSLQSSSVFTVSAVKTTSTSGLAMDAAFAGAGTVVAPDNTLNGDATAQAKLALTAIQNAVSNLGSVQGRIGAAQNQLGYAISLAQSQISNFSAAESRIRDTDVAAEAANLTKAQVLQQASIAAMAQANSAPQAVLSLLRG